MPDPASEKLGASLFPWPPPLSLRVAKWRTDRALFWESLGAFLSGAVLSAAPSSPQALEEGEGVGGAWAEVPATQEGSGQEGHWMPPPQNFIDKNRPLALGLSLLICVFQILH